jgi:anti-anti-sigma regulatory factor
MEYRLADFSLVFSTRDRGARMRADLLERMDAARGVRFIIDFDGVLSASYSFIDEFLGALIQEMGDSAPEIANVSPAVAKTIERSLTRRGLDADRVLAASLQTA